MTTPTYNRLNKDDAIVLLVDHQTGLISLVQDFSPNEFKNNVLALADLAKFFELPTILTTSFEQGPNGPLVPELKEMFPDAPYIARPGQINAWDNEDFVKAIKATGRKQIIMNQNPLSCYQCIFMYLYCRRPIFQIIRLLHSFIWQFSSLSDWYKRHI